MPLRALANQYFIVHYLCRVKLIRFIFQNLLGSLEFTKHPALIRGVVPDINHYLLMELVLWWPQNISNIKLKVSRTGFYI